jgi:hypothetical protein
MNNKKAPITFLRAVNGSLTNTQQNVELLSTYVVNTKTRRLLLSRLSMEEVRMFASFEETLRCIDNKNKYSELRLTSIKEEKLVFTFTDGSNVAIPSDSNRQFSEDMSMCVHIEQIVADNVCALVWKNMHTDKFTFITGMNGYVANLVMSKNGKICVGREFAYDMHNSTFYFVLHLDEFPKYRYEPMKSLQSALMSTIVLQFMDHDATMLLADKFDLREYSVISTSAFLANERLLRPIKFPTANFAKGVVGSPYSGLLAWHAKSSIGLYDTATDKLTTLKRYDEHTPEMTITDFRYVKIAFSQRYVAFAFQIQQLDADVEQKTFYISNDRESKGSMIIIVYDTADQILYKTRLGGWVVIECIRFLNDSDNLIISTTKFGMEIWDFKKAKLPTNLEITYGDIGTYWDKIFEGVKSSLSFSGNSHDKNFTTWCDVAYRAPFSKGAGANKK